MKKHKDILKKLFSREKEGNKGFKKTNKPWVLQYMWESEEAWRRDTYHGWGKYRPDWQDHYDKYMDLDHAKRMVERDLRSFLSDKFRGRMIRLFNKESQEVVEVHVQDKKLIFNLFNKTDEGSI